VRPKQTGRQTQSEEESHKGEQAIHKGFFSSVEVNAVYDKLRGASRTPTMGN